MRSATRVMVSTFGTLAGLSGIEHGLGELLQGNVAPAGLVFASWPTAAAFRSLNGEPAMTIIPNLLLTGILAIFFSALYIGRATLFVEKKHTGLTLFLLCIPMLLAGAGFGPPLLGSIVAVTATGISAPLRWWRAHLPAGLRHFLAASWPWLFGACLANWLILFAGIAILGHFFGVTDPGLGLVAGPLLGGFGLLPLAIIAAIARDIERGAPAPGVEGLSAAGQPARASGNA